MTFHYTITRHYGPTPYNAAQSSITEELGDAPIDRILDLIRSAFANGARRVDVTCERGVIAHTQTVECDCDTCDRARA